MSQSMWDAFSRRLFDQNLFGVKLGLDNIRRALELEEHPERSAPAIVVGGTNGKGETAAFLSAILQAHGRRVGLYTSPHLIEVRERFRVDGQPVSRDDVLRVGRQVLDRYGGKDSVPCLTFFELTTLMAALLFRDAAVEVGIYEVGLGGRLDAVNAIEPALTVLTNIDLDHQAYLGDTLEAIAGEKAALIRPEVPVVVAKQSHEEALRTLEAASNQRMQIAGRDFEGGSDFALREPVAPTRRENAATALAAARTFLGEAFSRERAELALRTARWPGRMELRELRVGNSRLTCLLDAAHNPGGASRLFDFLAETEMKIEAVVCGGMADKDLEAMFAPLARLGAPVYGAVIDSSRAADASRLRAAIPESVLAGIGRSAEILCELEARQPRLVLIFGSIYLLGECLALGAVSSDDLTVM